MRIPARTIALVGAVALALANLGRIPAGALAGRNAPITLADLVLVLVWATLAFGIATGHVKIVVDRVLAAALMFVAVAAVSTVLAFQRYGFVFEILAFLARWVLYFGWYPFVAWCLNDEESRAASAYVDSALLAICAFGVLQSAFLPEFASLLPQIGDVPAWEYQGRRLVSTLLDPNFAGAMAVLALLPRLARVAEGGRESAWALLIPVVAIALSASRSSVLALGAGIGMLVLARGFRPRLLKTLAIGTLLALPAIPALIAFGTSMNKFSIDASAAQRLVTWKRAFLLFSEHPLLGIGFNATRQAQVAHGWRFIGGGDTGFDGGLLFVMVMTGVVGGALYVLMLGRAVLSARRAWRDPDAAAEDRAHATATAASVVAIVIHSLFSNSLLLPFVMQVLWVRFGRLAHVSADRQRRLGYAIALPLVLATACSPCFGTISCTTGYRVQLQGSIADYASGNPVSGAAIHVTFQGAEQTAVRVDTTDAQGFWDVGAPTSCCDRIRAQVTVQAPNQPPYVVPDIAVRTLDTSGDAQLVGRWLNRPLVRYGITILRGGQPLSGATVTFQPVGGIPVTPIRLQETTAGDGIFHLEALSDRLGEMIGTLTVNHPVLAQPWQMQGFTVPAHYVFELPRVISVAVYDQPVLAPVLSGRP